MWASSEVELLQCFKQEVMPLDLCCGRVTLPAVWRVDEGEDSGSAGCFWWKPANVSLMCLVVSDSLQPRGL